MRQSLLALICLVLGGCTAEPVEQAHHLLSPGRQMLLTAHIEMASGGVGVSESGLYSEQGMRVVEHEETPFSSRGWRAVELPLTVTEVGPAMVRAEMTVRRLAAGSEYREDTGETTVESWDTGDPETGGPADEGAAEDLGQIMAASFLAAVDPGGRVSDIGAHGGPFDTLAEELEENRNEGDTDEFPMTHRECQLRMLSLGSFSALEDLLAYLPPAGADVGDSWTVIRERVHPYLAYEFYMFTSGAAYSAERTTCSVTAVAHTPRGREVTVYILGRRVPQQLEEEPRVEYFETVGTLTVNVDSWEVVQLCITSQPRWLNDEDKLMLIRFTETLALRAADQE